MFRIRLKELREDKNMSQQEFAAAIGVAQSAVGNWESGTRKPRTTDQLEKIADFFGVSIDYLLGRNEERKKPTPVAGDGQNSLAKQNVLDKIDDMSDSELLALSEMIETLKRLRQ